MRRLVVILTLLATALAVVGAAAGSAGAAATPLGNVTVAGTVGTKPALKFAKPFTVKASTHRVVTTGAGAKLATGEKVTFDFLLVDGRTGKQIETSFGSTPGVLTLDNTKTAAPIVKGLTGATVGSRVVVAIAPKDGLAKNLSKSGVKKNDSLLFVVDVKDAHAPLTRAFGTPVAPVPGLPTVTLDATGKPTIKVPATAAPTQLVAQNLITGGGATVAAGQTVTVQYTGVIWGSGKQFDSSWDRGASVDFAIGSGNVIAGWDEGLVGKTVGSQVVLVVPPDKGYGTSGNESAGITGTDTLVFVVDILDAS